VVPKGSNLPEELVSNQHESKLTKNNSVKQAVGLSKSAIIPSKKSQPEGYPVAEISRGKGFSLSGIRPLSFHNPSIYCYINSLMQVFLATESLHDSVYKGLNNDPDLRKNLFLAPFVELWKPLDQREEKDIMEPIRLYMKSENWFRDFDAQQDSSDVFAKFMNYHDFWSDLIRQMFMGSMRVKHMFYKDAERTQVKPDQTFTEEGLPFFMIPLGRPAAKSVSIVYLLGKFFGGQNVDVKEKGNPIYRKAFQEIENCPGNLFLYAIGLDDNGVKIQTPVEFSLSQPLSVDNCGNYQLYAVIMHHGHTIKSGHYNAHVKYGDQWWFVSDSIVEKNHLKKLCDKGYEHDYCSSSTASYFFYKKL
jgi:hypothetical protein